MQNIFAIWLSRHGNIIAGRNSPAAARLVLQPASRICRTVRCISSLQFTHLPNTLIPCLYGH